MLVVSGCYPQKWGQKDTPAPSQTGKQNTANAEPGKSWTLDTTPVTLDWYINEGWFSKKWNPSITLYDKIVTETTGVNINIMIPSAGGNEKLFAMAASGELPDIMTIDNWNGVREQMTDNGSFRPMNQVAEKYAPELLQTIPESMKDWLRREDGNWYAITNFFTAPEWMHEGSYIENNNGVVARKDIMDQLGIRPEDFTTQEGTIAALKKVRKANLSYNGKKVFPLYVQWNDWVFTRMWGTPWEKADGSWEDYRMHPKYIEVYQFLNRLWREGLLSNDNLTQWAGSVIEQGLCFAYIGSLDDIRQSMTILTHADSKMFYTPVGPIRAKDGSQPYFDQSGTGWTSTYITKDCTHPDRAVRLLSFLASEEGQMLGWFGVEGDTYDVVKGKAQFSKQYLRMEQEDPEMADKVYGIDTFWPMQQKQFYQRWVDPQALPLYDRNFHNIAQFYSSFAVHTPETMGVGPAQGTVEASVRDSIDKYWTKQARRMVLAGSAAEVEKIYADMVTQVKLMGYDKLYAISNQKFLELKKKVGKVYSFPLNKQP